MVRPLGARNHGAVGVRLAVPVGDPDLVGLDEARADGVDEIDDAGVLTAVDARQVAVGMEFGGPCGQERQHRRRVVARAVVGLHVVVDRVAGRDPLGRRLVDRVVGGRGPLGRSLRRHDRRTPAPVAGRLQPDIDRQQNPACRRLLLDPARAEIGLRAGLVRAPDVDPDRAVGRCPPGRHRRRARGRAGVEPEARVDRIARPVNRPRARARAVRGRASPALGGRQFRRGRTRVRRRSSGANDAERPRHDRRVAVPRRGHDHAGGGDRRAGSTIPGEAARSGWRCEEGPARHRSRRARRRHGRSAAPPGSPRSALRRAPGTVGARSAGQGRRRGG